MIPGKPFWMWLLLPAAFAAALGNAADPKNQAAANQPTLVVFDFESPFDNGKLGRKVTEMFRGHAFKRGEFVMLDRISREQVMEAASNPRFNSESAPREVAKRATEFFDAQIAIYGRVERIHADEYVTHVRILDLRRNRNIPVLQDSYTTAFHALQVAVDKSLDEFLRATRDEKPDPLADDSWQERKNLCRNGGFELGDGDPENWERVDGLCTFWIDDPFGDSKVITIDTDVNLDQYEAWLKRFQNGAPASAAPKKTPTRPPKYDTVGGITGAHLYSDPIPIRQGIAYRCDLLLRGPGGNTKCFVKGYAPFVDQRTGEIDHREVYRAQMNISCKTNGDEWEHFAMVFHPSQPFLLLTIRSEFDGGKLGDKLRRLVAQELKAQQIMPMIDSDEAVKRIKHKQVGHLIKYDESKYRIAKVVYNLFKRATVVWGDIVKDGAAYKVRYRLLDVRHQTATTKDIWRTAKTSPDTLEKTSKEIVKGIIGNCRLVAFLRVKLDAYWPPGVYYFDNVWITEEPPGTKTEGETGREAIAE